jgi:hypothetical protein
MHNNNIKSPRLNNNFIRSKQTNRTTYIRLQKIIKLKPPPKPKTIRPPSQALKPQQTTNRN